MRSEAAELQPVYQGPTAVGRIRNDVDLLIRDQSQDVVRKAQSNAQADQASKARESRPPAKNGTGIALFQGLKEISCPSAKRSVLIDSGLFIPDNFQAVCFFFHNYYLDPY